MQRTRPTKLFVLLVIVFGLAMFLMAGTALEQVVQAPASTATGGQARAILDVVLASEERTAAMQMATSEQGSGTSAERTSLLLVDHSLCFGTASVHHCDRLLFDDEPSTNGLHSPVAQQLLARLVAANRTQHRFAPGELPVVALIGLTELQTLDLASPPEDVAGFWANFHRAYPRSSGFVMVSRPVVVAAGSEAMVHVTRHCGGRCGAGTVYLLVRDSGGWRIREAARIWEA